MRSVLLIFAVLSFHSFCLAIDLKCELESFSWGYVSPGGVKCVVGKSGILTILEPNRIFTMVNGQTSMDNVKLLVFNYQTVNFIPKGLGKLFPQLEGLQLYSSKLKEIRKKDFAQFPWLKQLRIHNNDLEYLPADLFEGNTELRYIYFGGNQLKFIGENILSPLTKLSEAHFGSNVCIDKSVSLKSEIPALIEELILKCKLPQNVKDMILHEKFKDLESQLEVSRELNEKLRSKLVGCDGNLDSATQNLWIALKNFKTCLKPINQVSEIVDLICKIQNGNSCNALNFKVKFPSSKISKIVDDTGNLTTKSIEKLQIIDQPTLFLPSNFADKFSDLVEFSIIDSGLFTLEAQTFENLTELTKLEISGNKIIEIPSKAFINLKKLLNLNLSFNKLEIIVNDAFLGLEKLQELQLNDNFLTSINGKIFSNLKNLKVLQLQNNKIEFIASNLLSQITKISSLNLGNNSCIDMSFPDQTKDKIENEIVGNCFELQCDFQDDPIFVSESKQVSGKTCITHDLIVEHSISRISNTKAISSNYFDAQNVTAFVAVHQNMKFLPFEFSKVFPNLSIIWIKSSQLQNLQKNDFKGFTKLADIIIQGNNLTSIDADTFNEVLQLELLDLSNNKIVSLPMSIFANLLKLNTLILSNNQIAKLSADLLSPENVIISFRATQNRLEFIDPILIKFLVKAQLIDFTANVCVDLKYDKDQIGGIKIVQFYGEISFECILKH